MERDGSRTTARNVLRMLVIFIVMGGEVLTDNLHTVRDQMDRNSIVDGIAHTL